MSGRLKKAGVSDPADADPGRSLGQLTRQVAVNNHLGAAPTAADGAKLAFLRAHIRHVIYVVKENRNL